MRSEHVFAANDKVINRFMLCSLASKTMRGFVKPQMASPKVINEILEMIGNGKVYETPKLKVERVDRILPV